MFRFVTVWSQVHRVPTLFCKGMVVYFSLAVLIAARPLKGDAKPVAGSTVKSKCFEPVQTADSLENELKKAAVVIKGRVIAIGNKDEDAEPGVISEHNPLLRKAVVETDELLKGTLRQKIWTVYYAASEDVLWFHSPKLKKGQAAIFLLQLNQLPLKKRSVYSVLNQLDVQSPTASATIKALLKRHSKEGKTTASH